MLQRVQAEVGELGGFLMAVYPDHPAVVVKVIVNKVGRFRHTLSCRLARGGPPFYSSEPVDPEIHEAFPDVTARSRALAQTSRNPATGESITTRPLCWMRSAASPVTRPISSAATPYCAASDRRAATLSGATLTIARAPHSPNRADSGATGWFNATTAPFGRARPAACEAKQDSAMLTARPPSETSCADRARPLAARPTRQSISRFSPSRSRAGGSPATIRAMVLEYSEEENSSAGEGKGRPAASGASCPAAEPSRSTITSPASRKAIFRTREQSSRIPSTPMTGVA